MVFSTSLSPFEGVFLSSQSSETTNCDANIIGLAAATFSAGFGLYSLLVAGDRAYLRKSWTAHAVVGASLCMGSIALLMVPSCDAKIQ